jgi:hypothetical protein
MVKQAPSLHTTVMARVSGSFVNEADHRLIPAAADSVLDRRQIGTHHAIAPLTFGGVQVDECSAAPAAAAAASHCS